MMHVEREHDGLEITATGRAVELAAARRFTEDRLRVARRFMPFIRDPLYPLDPFYRCKFCNVGDTSRIHVGNHIEQCHSEQLLTSHK